MPTPPNPSNLFLPPYWSESLAHKPHPSVVKVWARGAHWALGTWLVGVPGVLMTFAWLFGAGWEWHAILILSTGAPAVAAWAIQLVLMQAQFRASRFCLGPGGIEIETGGLYHIKRFIPYGSIVSVNSVQSRLERRLGISSVHINTVGTYGSGAIIQGVQLSDQLARALMHLAEESGSGRASEDARPAGPMTPHEIASPFWRTNPIRPEASISLSA